MEPELDGYQGILQEIEESEASCLRISLEEYRRRKRAFLAEVEALSRLPVVTTPRGEDDRWRRKMEQIALKQAKFIKALVRDHRGSDFG
ncbi:MAG: hypothetical protein ACE5KR_01585 [Candidatus Bipolaricaulia bacterium]